MFGKHQDLAPVAIPAQRLAQLIHQHRFLEQLVLDPQRHRRHEAAKATRCEGKIGFQQSLELGKRLFIEDDGFQFGRAAAACIKAMADGLRGKRRIVFAAGKPFLLCCGDDGAIAKQTGGAVMIPGRYSKNRHSEPADQKSV